MYFIINGSAFDQVLELLKSLLKLIEKLHNSCLPTVMQQDGYI